MAAKMVEHHVLVFEGQSPLGATWLQGSGADPAGSADLRSRWVFIFAAR